MSLYGNTANIQKKNGVEPEKKGLREIEQERAKPEANGEVKKKAPAVNPKYINYQAISERPKTSVLPQESVKIALEFLIY